MRRTPWLVTWFEAWGREYWQTYLGWRGRPAAVVERLAARLGPAHLCISPTTAARLKSLPGAVGPTVHVIPAGIHMPQIDRPPPRQRLKVVIAGRLLREKRVDLAIRAWPGVVSRLPGAELHVIGDGPQRAAWEELSRAEQVGQAVRFHGQLAESADVWREIASASLVLQPSAREGQSLVVMEAMALGTPVLAADGPETAVADFIGRDGPAAGALVPVGAGPADWADRICRLLSDDRLSDSLSAHGRTQAAELDWPTKIAPRLMTLYREIAGK
jgi:glycosyltransferase involved in cell wall biosynthesis